MTSLCINKLSVDINYLFCLLDQAHSILNLNFQIWNLSYLTQKKTLNTETHCICATLPEFRTQKKQHKKNCVCSRSLSSIKARRPFLSSGLSHSRPAKDWLSAKPTNRWSRPVPTESSTRTTSMTSTPSFSSTADDCSSKTVPKNLRERFSKADESGRTPVRSKAKTSSPSGWDPEASLSRSIAFGLQSRVSLDNWIFQEVV